MWGLANRMRVVAAGLELRDNTNMPLTCYWIPSKELNARFEDLFLPIQQIDVKSSLPWQHRFLVSSFQTNPLKLLISNSIKAFSDIDYVIRDKDVYKLKDMHNFDTISLIRQDRRLYFKTCENFYGTLKFINLFKPISSIQRRIDDYCEAFQKPTIGIHIRRTDNTPCIQYSPTSLFINKMTKRLQENADTRFFLATDDPAEEKQLKTMFGNHIITHPKSLNRNSLQGIQDAVIDIYCLSNTDEIWGTYWSSFSAIAASLNKTPLEILSNKEK